MICISLGNLGGGFMAINIRGDQRLRLSFRGEDFFKLLFGQEVEVQEEEMGGEDDDED